MQHFSPGHLVRLPNEGENFIIGTIGLRPVMATRVNGEVVVDIGYAQATVSNDLISEGHIQPVLWKANQLSIWIQQRHPDLTFDD